MLAISPAKDLERWWFSLHFPDFLHHFRIKLYFPIDIAE
jgi:hypothetical protein